MYWHKTISNDELWKMAGMHPVDNIINRQIWGWIGHTLCKDEQCIAPQAMEWNPLDAIGRKRGCPGGEALKLK